MGYLHGGHLSLIRLAKRECKEVVVSIYVNPTQFNDGVDFKRYPKNTERDLSLCDAEGVDVVYMPENLYMENFDTWIDSPLLSQSYEGIYRPGHFRGVLTVVLKLFHQINPSHAYFGKKDYQQYLMVKKMVEDLDLEIKIIGAQTMREPSGLALSSRNARLNPSQKKEALCLIQGLLAVKKKYQNGACRTYDEAASVFEESMASRGIIKLEYFAVADKKNLSNQAILKDHSILLAALKIGNIRLIDNLELVE